MKKLLIVATLLLIGCNEKTQAMYPDRDPMKIECPDESGRPLSILETNRMWPEWSNHPIRVEN